MNLPKDSICGVGPAAAGALFGLSKIPILGALVSAGVSLACTRQEAKDTYMHLQPLLQPIISAKGRNSPEAIELLEELTKTAQYGAERENFHRFYVDKPDGWKELPADPTTLPFGFWW